MGRQRGAALNKERAEKRDRVGHMKSKRAPRGSRAMQPPIQYVPPSLLSWKKRKATEVVKTSPPPRAPDKADIQALFAMCKDIDCTPALSFQEDNHRNILVQLRDEAKDYLSKTLAIEGLYDFVSVLADLNEWHHDNVAKGKSAARFRGVQVDSDESAQVKLMTDLLNVTWQSWMHDSEPSIRRAKRLSSGASNV